MNCEKRPTRTRALSALDEAIMSAVLEKPGVTDSELAHMFGVTRQTINRRRNSEPLKEAIQKYRIIQREDLQRISKAALGALEALLKASDERVRLSAATAIVRHVLATSIQLNVSDGAVMPEFILENSAA